MRDEVSDSVVRQLQGESISTVGQVVVSDDPGAFLDTLSTMSGFNDLQANAARPTTTPSSTPSTIRREATDARTAEIAELTEQLSAEKETVDDKLAEAKELLADLEAEERERVLTSRGSTARVPASVPASGRAAAAVQYAMAQVGDAYVYGATGENAFDCAGLTMRAWAQAGVSLPHSSSAQFSSGPAHRRERAAARRPGVLLQPDQPRRHVHRQRNDRARRQPRHRRRRRGPLLDAVRRRGPSWLTRRRSKTGRPRWWVAGLSLFVVACRRGRPVAGRASRRRSRTASTSPRASPRDAAEVAGEPGERGRVAGLPRALAGLAPGGDAGVGDRLAADRRHRDRSSTSAP